MTIMEWLQNLLDSSSTPVATAFVLGLLTAMSPCPLATNIAAIGYIGKRIDSAKLIFVNGLLYTLGRVLAYTLLGVVLIELLQEGASVFGVQKFVGRYGEMVLGPLLILFGVFMLLAERINLPSLNFGMRGENLAQKGAAGSLVLGVIFALAFCPTSGVFYFGMLIPMSASVAMGRIMPAVFALATALPVILVAWILAFSAGKIGDVYGKIKAVQRWLNLIVGILFLVIGIYYCLMVYL